MTIEVVDVHEGVGEGEAVDLPAEPAGDRSTGRDRVVLVAAALVLVPTVAAMVSALRQPWAPTNDWALIELAVRDVGTADTPLLGAWSRFGWRHPGPLPFYLLAVPYRLVPAEHGLLFAAATLNFAAVAACAGLALRHPRTRALVLLAGLAALQRGLGIDRLGDPWNPTLPLLPFALYVLLCIELATASTARRWMLPAAAGVASFIVQAHVGFAQPVILVGLAALALRMRSTPSPWRRPSWRLVRAAAPTAAVLAVAWLPVALDQVARTGNLGMLVRWSLGDEVAPGMGELTEGRLPLGRVAESGAWLLAPFGWIGGVDPIEMFGYQLLGVTPAWAILWLPLALAGAVLVARRWAGPGDRPVVLAAAAVAAAGAVATLTDLLTAEGAAVYWPFQWVNVVVMLAWLAVGWAAAAALVRRFPGLDARGAARTPRRGFRPTPRAGATFAALGVVALPVGLALWGGTLGERPVQAESDALLALAPEVERAADGMPVVVANSTQLLSAVDLGLPVLLERAGFDWVERDDPRAAGQRQLHLATADTLEREVGTLVDDGYVEVLARSGDVVLLDSAPPEEIAARLDAVAEALAAQPGQSQG